MKRPVRILLSCLQSLKRHALPAYDFWRGYFIDGCEEAGIEVVEIPEVDWAEGLTYLPGENLERWRARTWDSVLDFVRRVDTSKPIDYFLGYLYPQQVETGAVMELQRLGIPCVNFYCDNIREFHRVPDEFRPFALHWVPEYEALPMYLKAGLPHVHLPMPCCVPTVLRSLPATETEPPTFIGSSDVLRADLLGSALDSGAEFFLCGPGWTNDDGTHLTKSQPNRSLSKLIANQIDLVRKQGFLGLSYKIANRLHPLEPPLIPTDRHGPPALGAEEYFRVTREAMVTIGVNRVATARRLIRNPLTYSRLRDLEAPMLGACYLTEWTEGLAHLYDLGTEVETYRTPEELRDKLNMLRYDDLKRRTLRQRGQNRALAHHTVARSLKIVSEYLGI